MSKDSRIIERRTDTDRKVETERKGETERDRQREKTESQNTASLVQNTAS